MLDNAGGLIGERYRLGERLREGRAFRVHMGLDTSAGRPVRVRTLRSYVARDAATRLGFRRVLEDLPDAAPGLLLPLDVVPHQETVAIIEPQPSGKSLAETLEGGLLEPKQALELFAGAAAAIAKLHAQSRAHGLVSPLEIHATADRASFEVTGIGLAGAFGSLGVPGAEANPYLAPEQRAGGAPSPQADVWALGVLLCELLSGRCPSIDDLGGSGWRRGVPLPLQRPLQVALGARPEDRFRNANALAEAVRLAALEPTEAEVRPSVTLPGPPSGPQPASLRRSRAAGTPSTASARMLTCLAWLVTSLIIPAAIALPVYGMWLRWERSAPSEVLVPDLAQSHMQEQEARKQLATLGLKLEVVDQEFNPDVPEGSVLWQNPPALRVVRSGRSIEVRLSRGAKAIRVPDVTNSSEDDAKKTLEESRLLVGDVLKGYSTTFPKGVILSQAPRAGRMIAEGGKVNLLLSEGPNPGEKAEGTEDGEKGSRPGSVQFTVPRGESSQHVRIRVTDDKGTRTVYDQLHEPGDSVRQVFTVFGKANVEILNGDTAVETKVID